MAYKPEHVYRTPIRILTPVSGGRVNGVPVKTTYNAIPNVFYCSFKSFGGTEKTERGVTVVEDTAVIEMHYDPQVTSGCRVEVLENGLIYEILGTPEDINMAHKTLRFKVRRVAGDV